MKGGKGQVEADGGYDENGWGRENMHVECMFECAAIVGESSNLVRPKNRSFKIIAPCRYSSNVE